MSVEVRTDPKLPKAPEGPQWVPWVTFKVNQWFKGGDTPDVGVWTENVPTLAEVGPVKPGDRLLVSGEDRWGEPPEDPIA